ncbi:MAG: hypothetical protein PVG57_05915, partial [Gammaproteobacteria bacterium]
MNTTATPAAFPHLDELERASPDSIESFRQALATGDKQLQERFAQEEPVEHLVRDRARLMDNVLCRAWSLHVREYTKSLA